MSWFRAANPSSHSLPWQVGNCHHWVPERTNTHTVCGRWVSQLSLGQYPSQHPRFGFLGYLWWSHCPMLCFSSQSFNPVRSHCQFGRRFPACCGSSAATQHQDLLAKPAGKVKILPKSNKLDKNPSDKSLGAVIPILAARKWGRKLLGQGEK